nr:MAG TPA: hypothetical protein [Inoviridae sp.]
MKINRPCKYLKQSLNLLRRLCETRLEFIFTYHYPGL